MSIKPSTAAILPIPRINNSTMITLDDILKDSNFLSPEMTEECIQAPLSPNPYQKRLPQRSPLPISWDCNKIVPVTDSFHIIHIQLCFQCHITGSYILLLVSVRGISLSKLYQCLLCLPHP